MNDIALIGRGRLGHALSRALRASGHSVAGPLGRGEAVPAARAVVLCVPDADVAEAARGLAPDVLVGHCSGASGLDVLAGHPQAFGLHPLMTFTGDEGLEAFAGAGAAVAGTTPEALAFAHRLAAGLGMTAIEVRDADRAAYHAAASVASNFLVTLEDAAELLLGADRELLVPLVRRTVDNWARLGAERALTGPIARGDEETVTRQRDAVADRAPELLGLFDALAAATRDLAARRSVAA
jgi:predicted short-subunit dehydrogenase-like oxidoreductase (DUF2520 family)